MQKILVISIVLTLLLISLGASDAYAQKKAVVSPKTNKSKTISKAKPFTMVNPTFKQLKNKLVEIAPGVQMEIGRFVKESSLKKNADVKRFMSKSFQKKYLVGKPVYKEEVKALSDRLIVNRTLTIHTNDPCAIPQSGDSGLSVCFGKNKKPKHKITAKMKKELKGIRAKIQKNLSNKSKFKTLVEKRLLADADKIMKMSDGELVAYLLNNADTKKVISHRSVVPFVSYKFDQVPALKLTSPNAKLPVKGRLTSVTTASKPVTVMTSTTSLAPQINTGGDKTHVSTPSNMQPPVDYTLPADGSGTPAPITFETTQTKTKEFLNGFTWGFNFGDVYEVEFAQETWLTDRYYARFSYDLGVGIGLRFPMKLTTKSVITKVDVMGKDHGVDYPATKLCRGVTDNQNGIGCARTAKVSFKATGINGSKAYYRRVGVPEFQVFDGKEFIFKFHAGAYFYASIPGPDFSLSFEKGFNKNRDFTTPIGATADATLVNEMIDGSLVGLFYQLGAFGVDGVITINPGLIISARHGKVKSDIYKKYSRLNNGGADHLALSIPQGAYSQSISVEREPNAYNRPWGVSLQAPVYSTELVITPQASFSIELEVAGYEWNTTIGPFVIDALSASLGRFDFQRHAGTTTHMDLDVSTHPRQ